MNAAPSSGGTVCAVVVTHHPDGQIRERLTRVADQVDELVVVDNASSSQVSGTLAPWLVSIGARWVRNETNLGIATALNQGAELALAGGHRWLLTLDQDTTVPGNLVRELARAVAEDSDPSRVGICGPTTDHQRERRCTGRTSVRRRMVITSGSLVNLGAWRAVAGFRDDFFIDMVEADFALRLARIGYHVILACRVEIDHRIGEPTSHRVLGMTFETSNHPAWRRYYIARNRIHVWRAEWRRAPAWVVVDSFGEVRDTIVMALAEAQRRQKLRATVRGLADGLRGRTGALVLPPE